MLFLLVGAWLSLLHQLAYSQQTWTVGTGTPLSCTEAAFTNALNSAADGDIIDFDCGAATCNDITINLSQSFWIDKSITIDGAVTTGSSYRIILDGGHNHRQFILSDTNTFWSISAHDDEPPYSEYTFTLRNIILQNGGVGINDLRMNSRPGWGTPSPTEYTYKGDGGCLYIASNGTAILNNVAFKGCQTIGTPTNIYNQPLDTQYRGGAIFVANWGTLYIDGCTFCSKFVILSPQQL